MKQTDYKDIFKQIRAGEEAPIFEMYKNFHKEFLKWSTSQFKATEDQSKDAFQEAILDFYQNVISGHLTVLTCSLKTYLFEIGKHKLLNIQKKEARLTYNDTIQLIDNGEFESFMDEENKEYTQEQISQALEELPTDCQEVLRLYYFKEYDMESISREMNYKNADTAKSKKSLCMKRLIQELAKLSKVFIL